MWRGTGLVLGVFLWFGTVSPLASPPVVGGRYRFSSGVSHRDGTYGVLTVADDGGEFAHPSHVSAALDCGRGIRRVGDNLAVDGSYSALGRAIQIDPSGRFEGTVSDNLWSMRLAGHFTHGGRVAVGTVHWHHLAGGDPSLDSKGKCNRNVAFEAHLVSRPLAPRPGQHSRCDDVIVGYAYDVEDRYSIYEKEAGCTTARETARQWEASSACRGLATGASCELATATCTAIRGGRFNRFASARCVPSKNPSGELEFVHRRPCKPPRSRAPDVFAWSINVDCSAATGYPVDSLLPDDQGHGPCGEDVFISQGKVRCHSVAGYSCTLTPTTFGPDLGFRAVCTNDTDRFQAIQLDYEAG